MVTGFLIFLVLLWVIGLLKHIDDAEPFGVLVNTILTFVSGFLIYWVNRG